MLPLLAIVAGFVVTLGARKLKEEEGRVLKLLSGLMMLGLGFVMLLAAEGLTNPFTAPRLMVAALAVTALLAGLPGASISFPGGLDRPTCMREARPEIGRREARAAAGFHRDLNPGTIARTQVLRRG